MLIDSLGSGGAQRQFVYLASALKRAGHDVSVGYYHDERFYFEEVDLAGIERKLLHSRTKLGRIAVVRRWLRSAACDVVVSFLDSPNLMAELSALPSRSFRLVVSERNTSQLPLGWRDQFRFRLHRLADRVVANSYSQGAILNSVGLGAISSVIVNSVDLKRFYPSPERKETSGSLRVLTLASYQRHKNPDLIAEYCRGGGFVPGTRFEWFGNSLRGLPQYRRGNVFEEVRRKVDKAGVSHRVLFNDVESDVVKRYHAADVFCLPSFWEGTPNVICEAMACGLPVLCSNVCDNPRIVKDGVNGFLFDPASGESFAAAVRRIVEIGSEGRRAIGDRNAEYARREFSSEVFFSKWFRVLEL